jgi:hypothetical protein
LSTIGQNKLQEKNYMFIPEVKYSEIDENLLMIPIFGSPNFCYLRWEKEDKIGDFLKKNSISGYDHLYVKLHSYFSYDGDEDSINTTVYEVKCDKSQESYFLIVVGELWESECIFHSICLPHNYWNVLYFFRDFILPFSGKNVSFT